ncbi:hypothetical protein FRX31_023240 [Thalictrum thalictroides]|uniref:Uncharacterized protein n=1 Tax=Thalictrum thalictroides TaxID=46969 RepID=A0A7J6VQM9_THATH|nr:hypothetical protein FRX31_023240 [Thalictrum thalictroides]
MRMGLIIQLRGLGRASFLRYGFLHLFMSLKAMELRDKVKFTDLLHFMGGVCRRRISLEDAAATTEDGTDSICGLIVSIR